MKKVLLVLSLICTTGLICQADASKTEAKALEQRLQHYHKIRSQLTKAQREYASVVKEWQEYCNSQNKNTQMTPLGDPECVDRPPVPQPAPAPANPEVPKPQTPSTEHK